MKNVLFFSMLVVLSGCGTKRGVVKQDAADFSDVVMMASKMPEFLEGNFGEWIAENLKYPKKAMEEGQSGRVYVRFIVDKKGQVTYPQVIRSSGYPLLDAEAVRVVGMLPAWSPAENNGKKVRVYYNIPINFALP